MKVICVGGGPAGLYLSMLLKRDHPDWEVTVFERNPKDHTFGFGVVFSDETLENLWEADAPSHEAITRAFAHWDTIDIHVKGQVISSSGHGFSGIARRKLNAILYERAVSLGVDVRFETEVKDVRALKDACDLLVGADGIRSLVRSTWADVFKPSLDPRKCKYIWLGTDKSFDAFTFIFEQNEHGTFQVHAYRYDKEMSTFIVECDRQSWERAGLDRMTTEESLAYLERLFAKYLDGARLHENRSNWIEFVTVKNERWHHENVVLIGDAAHTAHFSIGSGTKLAIEDAIALAKALDEVPSVPEALERYHEERWLQVAKTQRAAQDSLRWFENVKRYLDLDPLQFSFSLLTRSKRIGWENLKMRDPAFVDRVQEDFAARAKVGHPSGKAVPPMFMPFELRGMRLENRVVVSPMCMYSAQDGTPTDFHLVHLGQRAMGGAGLVMAEMTNVSPEGRITLGCTGMWSDAHLAAWKRIVDFVHANSAAKIGLQLGHAGRKGSVKRPWEEEREDDPLVGDEAWEVISASPIPYHPYSPVPREVDRAEMDRLVAAYVRAARLADEAGFDLLEIHFAHGYLLSSFLSPLSNQRKDAYGGPLTQRMRFPMEVFEAVRAAWPEDKPISVRISATDWVPGGFTGEDAVELARALKAAGCDVIDVSTGQTSPLAQPIYGRMWQTRFADQVRNEAKIPTIAVGNITTADQVNTILAAGRADLCALARPHLPDPHWTLRAAAEMGYADPRWPNPYLRGKDALERFVDQQRLERERELEKARRA